MSMRVLVGAIVYAVFLILFNVYLYKFRDARIKKSDHIDNLFRANVVMAGISMMVNIFLSIYYVIYTYSEIKDGGIIILIVISGIGVMVRRIIKKSKCDNLNKYFLNIIIGILILMMIFYIFAFGIKESYELILIIISILLGKYIWSDTTKNDLKNEVHKLFINMDIELAKIYIMPIIITIISIIFTRMIKEQFVLTSIFYFETILSMGFIIIKEYTK